MFTGIVAEVGKVRVLRRTPDGGAAMEVATAMDGLVPGESVAVDGACLTVETVVPGGFTVHAASRHGDH